MDLADGTNGWFSGRRARVDPLVQDGGGEVYADRQLVVTRTVFPPGLIFAGEIDLTNSHAVSTALSRGFPPLGDAHLDLSRLMFADISGIRALVDAADALAAGRRLLLHGLPEQLEVVINVTGWADWPNLCICRCEARQS